MSAELGRLLYENLQKKQQLCNSWILDVPCVQLNPEVWLDNFGPKCDVWSLGCIMRLADFKLWRWQGVWHLFFPKNLVKNW